MKLTFIIVLYNKSLQESLTYKSLILHKSDADIIVYDNSDCKMNTEIPKTVTYFGDGVNHGLSYAYNYVVNMMKDKNIGNKDNQFLALLDDDTEITDQYLVHMKSSIQNNKEKADIFVPVVMSGNKIMSPFNVWKDIKILAVKEVAEINPDQVSAINSGLIIRLSVFDQVMYDENYFLDCVDHDFFRKVRKNQIPVQIVQDTLLYQTFSRDEECDKNTRLKRFRIYQKDFKYFCSISKLGKVFYYLSITKMAIRYNRQYQTTDFFN